MISRLFNWFKNSVGRKKEEIKSENLVVVTDLNGVVSAKYPEGQTMSIKWNEIENISIHTNDSGPFGADNWWILKGKKRRCAFPLGATGEKELLPKFQALGGFNNEQFIKAMGCTENEEFVCWEHLK